MLLSRIFFHGSVCYLIFLMALYVFFFLIKFASLSISFFSLTTMQVNVKDISVSTAFGACVGVASKKLAKDAMYGVGLAFIGLQTLAYLGYVDINWKRIESDIVKAVDQDGDGKLSISDGTALLGKFLRFLGRGLPNAAGFTTGFYVGVKLF
jgi:uncharacterized membrane protein (Fun14 family)